MAFSNYPETKLDDVRKWIESQIRSEEFPFRALEKMLPFLEEMNGKQWTSEHSEKLKSFFPVGFLTISFQSSQKACVRVWMLPPSNYSHRAQIFLSFDTSVLFSMTATKTCNIDLFHQMESWLSPYRATLAEYEKIVARWNIALSRMKAIEKNVYDLGLQSVFGL